ncbi:MAG: hypothetical protein HXY46_00795 [Syntrophaceae bacterium]|nr:hypothetical protein [Syntrophaceae bacterium]
MLYETLWLGYALAIAIFLSIGFLGLILSISLPGLKLRTMPVILSVLIILTSLYFSSRWNTEKKGIQALAQQIEMAITRYLDTHKK